MTSPSLLSPFRSALNQSRQAMAGNNTPVRQQNQSSFARFSQAQQNTLLARSTPYARPRRQHQVNPYPTPYQALQALPKAAGLAYRGISQVAGSLYHDPTLKPDAQRWANSREALMGQAKARGWYNPKTETVHVPNSPVGSAWTQRWNSTENQRSKFVDRQGYLRDEHYDRGSIGNLYYGAEKTASGFTKKYMPGSDPRVEKAMKTLNPAWYGSTWLGRETYKSFREAPIATTVVEVGSYAASGPLLKAGGKVASAAARTKAGQVVIKEATSASIRATQKVQSAVRPAYLEAKFGARKAALETTAKIESKVASGAASFKWAQWTRAQKKEIDRWAGNDPARQRAAAQYKTDLNRWISDIRAPENVAARTTDLQKTLTDLKQQKWWNNLPKQKQQQVVSEWDELRAYRNKKTNITNLKEQVAATRANLKGVETQLADLQRYHKKKFGSLSPEEWSLIRKNQAALKEEAATLRTRLGKQTQGLKLAKMTPEGRKRFREKTNAKASAASNQKQVAEIEKNISSLQVEIKDLDAQLADLQRYHKKKFGSLSPEEWSLIRKNKSSLKQKRARRVARLENQKRKLNLAKKVPNTRKTDQKAAEAQKKKEETTRRQKQQKQVTEIEKNISSLQAEIKDLDAQLVDLQRYHKKKFGSLSPEEWSLIRKNKSSLKQKRARRAARLENLKKELNLSKMSPDARKVHREKTKAQKVEAERKAKIKDLEDRIARAEAELKRYQSTMLSQNPETIKAYKKTISDLKRKLDYAKMSPEARKRVAQEKRRKNERQKQKEVDAYLSDQIASVKGEISRRLNPGSEIVTKEALESTFSRGYKLKDITPSKTRSSQPTQPRLTGKKSRSSRRAVLKGSRGGRHARLHSGIQIRVLLPNRKRPLLLNAKNIPHTRDGRIDLSKLSPGDLGLKNDPEFSAWLAENLKRFGKGSGKGGRSASGGGVREVRTSSGTILLQRVQQKSAGDAAKIRFSHGTRPIARPLEPNYVLEFDLRGLDAEASRTKLSSKTRVLLTGKTKTRKKTRQKQKHVSAQKTRHAPRVLKGLTLRSRPRTQVGTKTHTRTHTRTDAAVGSREASATVQSQTPVTATATRTAQTTVQKIKQDTKITTKQVMKLKSSIKTRTRQKTRSKKSEPKKTALKRSPPKRKKGKQHREVTRFSSPADVMSFIFGFGAPQKPRRKEKKNAGKSNKSTKRGRAAAR